MKDIDYRFAVRTDLERIVAIYNSTIVSRMVTADTEQVSVESKQKWFDEHDAENRPLWVITEKSTNKIIAWISFQSFYGRPAYSSTVEVSIYIDELYRGKGLGKQLLQFSIEQAPSFHVKTLLGFVFAHNKPSLNLFRSFGFENWGDLPNIALLDGVERSLIILGKRIAE